MNSVNLEKDKEAIVAIIKEMAESMTGKQSTRHWTEDTIWFDIPAFASKGIKPASQFFNKAFGGLKSCKIDILEMETKINENMAFVVMVQRINTVSKDGTVNDPLWFVKQIVLRKGMANGKLYMNIHPRQKGRNGTEKS